jgi:phosphoribosylformylglycinamidine cyclo-ligase
MSREDPPRTYADAGVDIDAGERLVDRIGGDVARTQRPEVIGGLGGFGGLFAFDAQRYRQPVLVSATDGVGTKLRLAGQWHGHAGIGIDLVAMCVNDVIVTGAEPLFFLDYYATGHLDEDVAARVIRGIADGCDQAGCALVGGETAEMPGMYAPGDYDLAGFCVGAVERAQMLGAARVAPGDVVLGLASSGPHANGYALIRRLLESTGAGSDTPCADTTGGETTLGAALLAPTRIYAAAVAALQRQARVHALAHITGGGLLENLPRALPAGTCARIDAQSWARPPVFDWLQNAGGIAEDEMLRTFNCGIGLGAIVPAAAADTARQALHEAGETVFTLGHIDASDAAAPDVRLETGG